MRPYLAIVKDSFREALASRVLWVLLLLITVVLLALTPFHWKSSIATELAPDDIRNLRNLAASLRSAASDEASPLTAHVWHGLSQRTRERLEALESSRGQEASRTRRALIDDLNQLIEREDFYQPELWAQATLDDRANVLLQRDELDQASRQQLNRFALEAALPGQLRSTPDQAVVFRYARWDLDFIPPIGRRFALETLDTFVLAFMSVFIGFFGIFAAVLVTAPIIPNMFDSGSLYLLLSKPISRPLLFLAKFLGGCSFVLINAAYLIVGLCLIVNLRFGIAKPQLLWSIPLFVFSFAIFYAVSAISGLVWKSTVMAIVATVIFWFLCTTVGSTKEVLEQFVIYPQRISSLVQDDGQLLAVRRNGTVVRWDDEADTFTEIFADEGKQNGPPMMLAGNSLRSLLFDSEKEQLVALDRDWPQWNIVVGRKAEDWKRKPVAPAPQGTVAMFRHAGRTIAVADGGVFEISTVPAEESALPEINLFGFKIPAPATKQPHRPLSQDLEERLPGDGKVAYDRSSGDLFVVGAGVLRRWSDVHGMFQEQQRIDVGPTPITEIAAGQGLVVLARKNPASQLQLFEAATLQLRSERELESAVALRRLAVSPNGRWLAMLFENDRLQLLDLSADQQRERLPRQGKITEIAFSDANLLISDVNDRVLTLSLPDLTTHATKSPDPSWIVKVYRYFVKPLYVVFPKPAQLQHTMQYVITGKDTMKIDGPPSAADTIKLDPWQPLVSNSVFIGVMLMLGCLYMVRQDF